MKIFFNKKIIFGIIVFSLFFSVVPKKGNAQWTVTEVGPNLVQNTITAANTGALVFSNASLQFKEFTLDGLGTMLLKQIIRQITTSVVSWINSGFEGSPSFLQNPGAFFLDVADQLTGEFLSRNGDLSALCSPFSIDIRIALAFRYRPNIPRRYTCTLGTIIRNTRNAVENASINGFTAGDFRQGGWPAFVSLTTEPQNNIYGAYLTAESDLSWRVANAQAQQRDELGAGNGFLSWRDPKCTRDPAKYNRELQATVNGPGVLGSDGVEMPAEVKPVKTKLDCPVQTPGSVISGSLQNNLNGPLRELEIADEINEIVNALFAQLVTQVLQKGLAGVSSRDSSGTSYLNQTISDINAESNPQVQGIKNELIKNVDAFKKNVVEYKANREAALEVMLGVRRNYDYALSCFDQKLNDTSNRYASDRQTIERNIAEINATVISQVSSKATNLLLLLQDAETKLKTLQEIQDRANAARTLNDLNAPSQKYSELLQSRGLTTPQDIQKSKEDLDAVKVEAAPLKADAERKLQICQIL
jgi:hypothetical protein